MNEEFVLEDKIRSDGCIQDVFIKEFLQLLKDDFNVGRKRFTKEELYLLLEKRAGKSLFNTHPREQTKSPESLTDSSCTSKSGHSIRNQTRFSSQSSGNKTAPEGVKKTGGEDGMWL